MKGTPRLLPIPAGAWSAIKAACLAVAALACPGTSRAQTATQVTTYPPQPSNQFKAPLPLTISTAQGPVNCLMNMTLVPGSPSSSPPKDWYLQPMVTRSGSQAGVNTQGWSTVMPDGTNLAPIPAFGQAPPPDGTQNVDWGDGSFLAISPRAASVYGLPQGTIFYSTRVNTTNTRPATATTQEGYGYDYRIFVYMTTNNGASWTLLPAPRLAGKTIENANLHVGLYSNFLFERSDGVIQVYYDNQATPHQQNYDGQQWLTMKELAGTANTSFSWGGEYVVDGTPGSSTTQYPLAGQSSVSEKGTYVSGGGNSLMFVTHEDAILYTYNGQHTSQVIVATLKSSDGGHTWAKVGTIQSNNYPAYNYLAPWHVRSKLTGNLYMVYRSDINRQQDEPSYNPALAVIAVNAGAAPDNSQIKANLFVVQSADDGATWQNLYDSTGEQVTPGGADNGDEPGVSEFVQSSGQSSDLILQWLDYTAGTNRLQVVNLSNASGAPMMTPAARVRRARR